ncbi:MAG: hypothetical protein AAF502_15915 [Bacteroidota bacterium]
MPKASVRTSELDIELRGDSMEDVYENLQSDIADALGVDSDDVNWELKMGGKVLTVEVDGKTASEIKAVLRGD